MSRKNSRIVGCLLTALLLVACRQTAIYSHYESVPMEGWEREDTVCFDFANVREDGCYKQEVGLRVGLDYPFMGLSLIVDQQIWPSGLFFSDTIHIDIANEDGKALGKGINNYQYNIPLHDVILHTGDSLHIGVRHYMKRERLPGIADIGITIGD